MSLDDFIYQYSIRPADVIILKHYKVGLLDHYVVYLGVDHASNHIFVANYANKGVKVLTNDEIHHFLQKYTIRRIQPFVGNDFQRNHAVQRALSRLGEERYSYIFNNCEHFANWVQNGEHKSQQVDDAVKGLALGGLIGAFAGLIILGIRSK